MFFLFQLATDISTHTLSVSLHPHSHRLPYHPFLIFSNDILVCIRLHSSLYFLCNSQTSTSANIKQNKQLHSSQNMLLGILSIAALLAVAGAQPQSVTPRTSRAITVIDSDIYLYGGEYH